MVFDHQSVPLARVREEVLTFRISTGHASEILKNSIERIGLINPPILLPQGDHFTIVCGFGRISACRLLGRKQIAARCLSVNCTFLDCALTAIADNTAQRALNVVETARCLGLLTKAAVGRDQCLQWLQTLGLPMNEDLADKLQSIDGMQDFLQQALIDDTIALPMALRLHAMNNTPAAKELCILFQELDLGLNRQRELLDWVQGIAMRERAALMEIMQAGPVLSWRQDVDMDRGHKSQQIRQYFKRRRYPAITAFEENYTRAVKKLKLPKEIQLLPPPHFEGRQYSLRLDFSNPQELSRLSLAMAQLVNSTVFLELLEPIKFKS